LLPGKALLEDAILGYRMFMRGKLHLLPHKTQGAEQIQKILQRIEAQKSPAEVKS
jgi:hypothetical protein